MINLKSVDDIFPNIKIANLICNEFVNCSIKKLEIISDLEVNYYFHADFSVYSALLLLKKINDALLFYNIVSTMSLGNNPCLNLKVVPDLEKQQVKEKIDHKINEIDNLTKRIEELEKEVSKELKKHGIPISKNLRRKDLYL